MNNTEKIIRILNLLGEFPYEMGLTDIAKDLGAAKGSVHKILQTLVKGGLITKDAAKRYRVGPLTMRLGGVYQQQNGLMDIVKPIITELGQAIGETVFLGMRDADHSFLVYKIEGPKGDYYGHLVAVTFPINSGAVGKLLAAYQDEDRIASILQREELRKVAPNTITDPESLVREFRKIREQRYAVSIEEARVGGVGVAFPIYNKDNSVSTCIGFALPKIRFDQMDLRGAINLFSGAADDISRRLAMRR